MDHIDQVARFASFFPSWKSIDPPWGQEVQNSDLLSKEVSKELIETNTIYIYFIYYAVTLLIFYFHSANDVTARQMFVDCL